MRGLEHLLVGGQRELLRHKVLGLFLMGPKGGEQELGIAVLEVVGRLFLLVLQIHVAILQAIRPLQVIDVVDTLQVHGQSLQAVSDFAGDGAAINASHLLEIGELGDFHAIEPDFPAQPPGAKRGVLPVILDEADVVTAQIKTQRLQ